MPAGNRHAPAKTPETLQMSDSRTSSTWFSTEVYVRGPAPLHFFFLKCKRAVAPHVSSPHVRHARVGQLPCDAGDGGGLSRQRHRRRLHLSMQPAVSGNAGSSLILPDIDRGRCGSSITTGGVCGSPRRTFRRRIPPPARKRLPSGNLVSTTTRCHCFPVEGALHDIDSGPLAH